MAEVREAEYRFGTMCGELDDKWLTISIIFAYARGWPRSDLGSLGPDSGLCLGACGGPPSVRRPAVPCTGATRQNIPELVWFL